MFGDQRDDSVPSILQCYTDATTVDKLPLYYIASGQRVPEDLHVANRAYLVSRALRQQRDHESFLLQDDELPLVMVPRTTGDARPGAGR